MSKCLSAPKIPSDLFLLMAEYDDKTLSDAVWQRILQDVVGVYNAKYGTEYDPHTTFLAYIVWIDGL